MGLRATQGNQKRLGTASTLYGTVTLSLSSRPERRDLRFSFRIAVLSAEDPIPGTPLRLRLRCRIP
jgi:hypothetical protein